MMLVCQLALATFVRGPCDDFSQAMDPPVFWIECGHVPLGSEIKVHLNTVFVSD